MPSRLNKIVSPGFQKWNPAFFWSSPIGCGLESDGKWKIKKAKKFLDIPNAAMKSALNDCSETTTLNLNLFG
jgi:hypothetical protein